MVIDAISCSAVSRRLVQAVCMVWCACWLPLAAWAQEGPRDLRNGCLEAEATTAVDRCTAALTANPQDKAIRLALGDAYMASRRYEEAIAVFEAGLERTPGDATMQARLTEARQMHDEARWIETRQQKRAQTGEQRIAASRYTIRCTKLSGATALAACDEGLTQFPGNALLYRGRGDALMDLKRYGEALAAYQDAQVLAPSDSDVTSGILKARTQRKVSAQKCIQLSGQAGLEACRAARLKGADDEAAILHRQGDLLKSMGKTTDAIASYQAALAIDGGNADIESKLNTMGVRTQAKPEESESVQPVAIASPAPVQEPKPKKAPEPISPQLPAPAAPAAAVKQKPQVAAAPRKTAPPTAASADRTTAAKSPSQKMRNYSNAAMDNGFTH